MKGEESLLLLQSALGLHALTSPIKVQQQMQQQGF